MKKTKIVYLIFLLVLSSIAFFVKTDSSYITSGSMTFQAYTFDMGTNHYISISTSYSGNYFMARYLTINGKTYAVTDGFASIPRTTIFTVDGQTYTYRQSVINGGWWLLGVIGIVLFLLSLRYDGAMLLFVVVSAISLGLLIQGAMKVNILDGVVYASGPRVIMLHSVTQGYMQFDEGTTGVTGFTVRDGIFSVTGYFDGVYMVESVGSVSSLTAPGTMLSKGSVYYFTSVPGVLTVNGEEYTYAGVMTLGWGWVVDVFSMPITTTGLCLGFLFALIILLPGALAVMDGK